MTKKSPDRGKRSGDSGPQVSFPVDSNSTPAPGQTQSQPTEFLIGKSGDLEAWWNGCPWATTLDAFSDTLGCRIVLQVKCKRWGCRHCGERKMSHYAHKVSAAEPNRLITLTVWTEAYETPRHGYDETRRGVSRMVQKLRRRFKEFEYFRVLEATKKGWPHYHLVVRSPYIPQPLLVELWSHEAKSKIVDVRKVNRPSEVYNYVMKYLGKQKHVPWTNRRVCWSRNFFKDDGFEKGQGLKLCGKEWSSIHPAQYVERECREMVAIKYSADLVQLYTKEEWDADQLWKHTHPEEKETA